jgi:hypothetical protein
VESLGQVVMDSSMAGERLKTRLDLYDCLQARIFIIFKYWNVIGFLDEKSGS